MNMEKLKELRDRIAAPEVVLGRYKYKENGCMCIVGHIFDMAGCLTESITEDIVTNGKSIQLLDVDLSIVKTMFGIDPHELQSLQRCNDEWSDNDQRKQYVLEKLDNLIQNQLTSCEAC